MRIEMRLFAPILLVISSCLLIAGGCGYTTASLHDENYSTIAVPIFGNRTFYRENEFRLTEAVKKEIETKTRYRVVGREEADTLLEGEIVGIQQPVLTARSTPIKLSTLLGDFGNSFMLPNSQMENSIFCRQRG